MKIDINNIPDLNYKGYLWFSDTQKPELIIGKLDKAELIQLPFVIEGNLWAETEQISINIKNIDGEYIVNQFDIKNTDCKYDTVKEYIAHDLTEVEKYKMHQHWEAKQDDDLLAGMSSLHPSWVAFVGFIHNNKNK